MHQQSKSSLDCAAILDAFQRMLDELGRLGLKKAAEVMDLVAAYYLQNRIPIKTQYLVEGLFEEGKI